MDPDGESRTDAYRPGQDVGEDSWSLPEPQRLLLWCCGPVAVVLAVFAGRLHAEMPAASDVVWAMFSVALTVIGSVVAQWMWMNRPHAPEAEPGSTDYWGGE